MIPLTEVALFAGVGGMMQGLHRAGWRTVAASEIDDKCNLVLEQKFPNTVRLGDVTKVDGRALREQHGEVTLLTYTFPCQDLSVAGKRAGLDGARSGLFYEAIRIREELGCPLSLAENVPGLLSSGGGKDFARCLSALVGGTVAVPADGWDHSGVVVGDRGITAWTMLDLQHFGPPQRRLRLFMLTAHALGDSGTVLVDPAEVLSLRHRVRGDSEASQEPRKVAPSIVGSGAGTARTGGNSEEQFLAFESTGGSWGVNEGDTSPPINVGSGLDICSPPAVVAFDGMNHAASEVHHSLRTGKDSGDCVVAMDPKMINISDGQPRLEDVCATLQSRTGSGGIGSGAQMQAVLQPQAVSVTGEVTHALTHEGHDASEDGTGRGTPIVVQPTGDRFQCVACGSRFGVNDYDSNAVTCPGCGERTRIFDAAQDPHDEPDPVVMSRGGFGDWNEADTITPLCARDAKDQSALVVPTLTIGAHVAAPGQNGQDAAQFAEVMLEATGVPRRLTPLECVRLMGWDEDHLILNGPPWLSDSAKYKMCGNGVGAPVAEWIGWRLAQELAL